MPRKSPVTSGTDDKLDIIIEYLYKLDKRDRLRTWGGFLKGIISLIPIIVLVWSAWYMYAHGDEFLSKIAAEAAQQAAKVTQGGANSIMEQFKSFGFPQ